MNSLILGWGCGSLEDRISGSKATAARSSDWNRDEAGMAAGSGRVAWTGGVDGTAL